MAGVQLQHPCLVPDCPETLYGLRGGKLGVCLTHRQAATVEVEPGKPLRYCSACYTFHPTAEFPPNSHICSASERHHSERWRRRRRRYSSGHSRSATAAVTDGRFVLFHAFGATFKAGVSALVKAMLSLGPAGEADRDEGKHSIGVGIVSFLRGESLAAKISFSILYAFACCWLGPLSAETWAIMAMAFFFLHCCLPYTHQRFYAQPLEEVRQAAAQLGLALSSSFQFLDSNDLGRYEKFTQDRLSISHATSIGRMITIFFTVALTTKQAFEAASKVWGVPRTWPLLCFLLLLGAVYFPARLRAMASKPATKRSQLLDAVMLVFGSSLPFFPSAYAWASGAHTCGFPEAFQPGGSEIKLIFLGFAAVIASSGSLYALLDGPISMFTAATSAVTGLRISFCLFGPWCVKVESGMDLSAMCSFLSFTSWLVGAITCVALKVRQETSQLLRYVNQLQAKKAEPLDSGSLYRGDPHLLLAVKMGSITPAHLPSNLRDRILAVMQVAPESLTGVIRPGCVMLGLEMRFHSLVDMTTACKALLSHCHWNTTLLDSTASDIDMSIDGSMYGVKDGQLEHKLHGIQGTSLIASVEPLAPSPLVSTLTLQLSRIGVQTFRVLLRCGGQYHELAVQERSTEDPLTGLSTVVVRLPEAELDGLGWLEVMLDTPDGSLLLSEASPMLFTSVPEVAAELSRMLPAHCPADSQLVLAGFLADTARSLQGQSTAPPALLLNIAEMGLTNCFKHLATGPALRDADQQGQGVLGSAVLSGSEEMVDMAMLLLLEFGLPMEPCKRAPDARGYSALHWAAEAGDMEIVYMLLAELPNPLKSWRGCQARLGGKTPAQLMDEAGAGTLIDEDLLREANEHTDTPGSHHHASSTAVWGAGVAAFLEGHPVVKFASWPALAAVICAQLGWQDPLAWGTAGVTCLSLFILLPCVYKEVYLKGLAEVRDLAAQQGLAVSSAFQFLGAPIEQQMYEDFAVQRASKQLWTSGVCTATAILGTIGSLGVLFKHWGLWCHAPVLLYCGAAVSLQAFAIQSKRLLLWTWLEPAITLLCSTRAGLFVIAWATGNPDLCLMPSYSVQSSEIRDLLLFGLVLPPLLSVLLVVLLSLVPKAPCAPVHLPSEIFIILFYAMANAPAAQWCINGVTGLECLGNIRNLLRVSFIGICRLLMAGLRLRAEKQNLCAFLSANAMRRAKAGLEPCQ